jgi:hypothetical protein
MHLFTRGARKKRSHPWLIWSDPVKLRCRGFTAFDFVFSFAAVLLLLIFLTVQQNRRPRECGDDDHSDIRGFSHEHDPSGAASVYGRESRCSVSK